MPPSKGKRTQKKKNTTCRRSARISQNLRHGPSAKESNRQKRRGSVQEVRPESVKSPRLEIDEDELTARENARFDGKTAASECETGNTAASREEVVGLDKEDSTMEYITYRSTIGAYLDGSFIGWEQGTPDKWKDIFFRLAIDAAGFARSYGIDMEGFNKLSKKDRQEVLESAKGYVIQGDVDEVAARFEGTWDQLCHCVLGGFLSKYILQKFWGEDSLFWWLEPDVQAKDGQSVPSQFGNQLNSLYKEFFKAHRYFAYAWSMMTIRLSTVTRLQQGEDVTFGKCMNQHRQSLVHSVIVPELLASKTMCLLLKDAKEQTVLKELQDILGKHAEKAVLMYSYPFRVRFEELEDLPTDYLDLPEGVRKIFEDIFHGGDDSPLHGKKVLAITQPASYRLGTVASHKGEQLISPGEFIIDWNWRDGRNLRARAMTPLEGSCKKG